MGDLTGIKKEKTYRDKIMSPADYQRMKNNQRINHGKKRKQK